MTKEEAIRRIKAWNLDPDDMEVLSVAIPELAESEDEKIRKLLVWQVHRNIEDETNDLARSVYDGIKGHDPDLEESIEDWKKCLDWLERQKEQQPAEWSEKDEFFRQQLIIYCENCVQDTLAAKCVTWLKSLRPQPKQEWSEEDKNIINGAVGALEAHGHEKLAKRLKSIHSLPKSADNWKPSEEQMEILGRFNDPVLKSLYSDLKKLL